MALLKNLRLTESKSLQFRLEAFNVFNHAQFFGPQAVDGNISSATFGQVVSAAAPRLVQAGREIRFLSDTAPAASRKLIMLRYGLRFISDDTGLHGGSGGIAGPVLLEGTRTQWRP